MPDRVQAVHLTKRARNSCLIRKTPRLDVLPFSSSLPTKSLMSSTAVTVAGIAAHAFRSNDVAQSRLSTRFVQTHIPRKSRSSIVELVVTASLILTSFTCVLEFILDPDLHLCDVVLGLDWSRQCQIAEMLPLVRGLECLDGVGE